MTRQRQPLTPRQREFFDYLRSRMEKLGDDTA